MIDFGDFSLVLLYSVPLHQFLGFLLSVELREHWIQTFFCCCFFLQGPCCVSYSVHHSMTTASWCFRSKILSCHFISLERSSLYQKLWAVKNELSVGKTALLTFISRTVLSSWCSCSRVLLPSTWSCGIFSHYGRWVVTWLALVAISEPSMRSWSLAWDLAPEWVGWQQDRSILALAPLFSGGPHRDSAHFMRGNRAVTVQYIWWPAGTAVS